MKQLDNYLLTKLIGKGSTGEVYLTSKTGTNELFASKKISRSILNNEKAKKYINNGICIFKQVNHPNILKFHEIKKTADNFYIITDYCNGGSLLEILNRVLNETSKPMSEAIVQHLGRQICSAVQFLHNGNILHRDLKLENILISFPNEKDKKDFNLLAAHSKLTEFGFARYLAKNELAQSVLGSPLYMDPNILRKLSKINNNSSYQYDEKADIWSLGVIFFYLLVGVPPFTSDSYEGLIKKIEKGQYKIPNVLKLSKQATSFINLMLRYNPNERLDINHLICHEFLTRPVSSFIYMNLFKAEKLFKSKEEIRLNVKEMNDLWAIFDQPEEGFLFESISEEMHYSNDNVDKRKRSIIVDDGWSIVDEFTDGIKEALVPIINQVNEEYDVKALKSEKITKSEVDSDSVHFEMNDEDKKMLNKAFELMNKDSYVIEPMFMPVNPQDEKNGYGLNV